MLWGNIERNREIEIEMKDRRKKERGRKKKVKERIYEGTKKSCTKISYI